MFALVLDEDKQWMFIIWMLDIAEAEERRGADYRFSEQCNADVWEECWGNLLEANMGLHQHYRLQRQEGFCKTHMLGLLYLYIATIQKDNFWLRKNCLKIKACHVDYNYHAAADKFSAYLSICLENNYIKHHHHTQQRNCPLNDSKS